jgi:trk system potassium uptake protein TrkA
MRIVIAGAGVTGRRLVAKLASGRHDVILIDLNRELCEAVSAELGVVAICGNATDIATLEEAEIDRADVVVALMRQSVDNLAFSLLARGAGVQRIIARMSNPKYRAAYERAGVTSILDVAGLFLDRLVLEIERQPVHEVATIADGQGAIAWVTVAEGAVAAGRALDEIRSDRRFPRGCLVAGLVRGEVERLLLPTGRDRVLSGDRVLLVGTIDGLTRAADLFGQRRRFAALFARERRVEPSGEARIVTSEKTTWRITASASCRIRVHSIRPGSENPAFSRKSGLKISPCWPIDPSSRRNASATDQTRVSGPGRATPLIDSVASETPAIRASV